MTVIKRKVAVGLLKRYQTFDLEIVPSLAGAFHEFSFSGLHVGIYLPKKPRLRDLKKPKSISKGPISCSRWKIRNGRDFPLSYSIHSLDVYLNTGVARKVRGDALGTANVSLFTKNENNRLTRLAEVKGQILEEAFEYWINILRWKSGIPTLCQFRYNRIETKPRTYLTEVASKKTFYPAPVGSMSPKLIPITKRSWRLAQQALTDNLTVPLWHVYLAEANQKLRLGDNRGFILSLAIASETFIRQLTNQFLKSPINPAFQKIVNLASLSRILDDWYRLGFNNAGWKRLKGERNSVKEVIELRNKIMHRGEDPALNKLTAENYKTAVLNFLTYGEK